jgi:G:T-mismatch repair DNA endonuclease (very short patch repair protein)
MPPKDFIQVPTSILQECLELGIIKQIGGRYEVDARFNPDSLPNKKKGVVDPKNYYKSEILSWVSKDDLDEFGFVPESAPIATASVPQKCNKNSKVSWETRGFFEKNKVTTPQIGQIIGIVVVGRESFLVNHEYYYFKFDQFKSCSVACKKCLEEAILLWPSLRYHIRNNSEYHCQSCSKLGSKNSFFGKHHSEESKQKQVESYGDRTGSNNPFYGKSHTEETKAGFRVTSSQPGEKNGFFGKTHTKETRKNLSEIGKERAKDPIYREQLRQNTIKSLQNRSYRMTKPERTTQKWLKENKIPNHYNLVLKKKYQYDFRVKDTNILIEVQGDYWHANPKIYTKPDELTERQLFKIEQDKKKAKFAANHGYRILYIWEQDIKNNNFSSLYELLEKDFDEV